MSDRNSLFLNPAPFGWDLLPCLPRLRHVSAPLGTSVPGPSWQTAPSGRSCRMRLQLPPADESFLFLLVCFCKTLRLAFVLEESLGALWLGVVAHFQGAVMKGVSSLWSFNCCSLRAALRPGHSWDIDTVSILIPLLTSLTHCIQRLCKMSFLPHQLPPAQTDLTRMLKGVGSFAPIGGGGAPSFLLRLRDPRLL